MIEITLKAFSPEEKLPSHSTPLDLYPVLVLSEGQWKRGVYWGSLMNEWRLEGQNNEIKVDLWCELPPTVLEK